MTTRPLSVPQIQKVSLAFALAWTVLCAVGMHYVINFSWLISAVDSAFSNLLLAGACIGISNMLGYYQPKNERILYFLVITLALTLVIIFIGKYTLLAIFYDYKEYKDFYNFSFSFRGLISFMCLAWCALANILWYRLEEQSETHERLTAAKTLAKEAELNKLRHQLQPHFLFNSLNSVFALTMINPKEAGVMITKLASFLRGTLKRDDEVWVSVAEEMEYIQLYLDIEKVRFSHRLNIEVNVADDTLTLCLPGTLLQPIIENAIKFGLYNTSSGITIKIDVTVENHLLAVRVQNPFDPEMKATGGTGFGLSAIKRRLYLLFANPQLLQTEIEANNLYITTLKIPQKNDQNNPH
ncbi:sensor histidine kinase [Pedobacter sandarakinus]|uniref:sensor histidine kinase n=1 Tax=Pedobacter sandarakinus TaxID=353156 RepID=UPI0022479BC2|nr:histidine kinase [Pedobacter sandarakinus]MCX2574999.1 histidine kinase [Pedobacter sandarakinus]